jgi:Calpain family cysteine protease
MLCFAPWFGRLSSTRDTRAHRPREFNASVEAVEDRTLMSALSAISWESGGAQQTEVFGLGVNNAVYVNKDSTGWVALHFHAEQLSAGLAAAGKPEVFAISSNHAVYVKANGKGWTDLGGDFSAISATADDTVFAIGGGDVVYVNHGSGFSRLGGYAKAISAGLDAAGKPEVYAIGRDNAVFVNDDAKGWVDLGGRHFTAISATADGTVFAIGSGNVVYVNRGSGFVSLGGDAKAISAGVDAAGEPMVYAIGTNNAAYVNDDGKGWVNLGGYVTEISATNDSTLVARGENLNSVYLDLGQAGFNYLGNIPFANPVAATAYSPAPASASLFLASNNGEPSYLDVDQGDVGDCWLLASLAEVAARDPQDIENMFTYDGTTVDKGATVGLYTVHFFDTDGSAFDVEVNTELPAGGEYYDFVTNGLGTDALWVALAEKAYAEANSVGYVTTSHEGGGAYSALNGGDPSWAVRAITGNSAGDKKINPGHMATAWDSGDFVELTTGKPRSSHIIGDHCYAVVGYNGSSSKPYQLFNPWGADDSGLVPGFHRYYGLFSARAAFISRNFDGQSLGHGSLRGIA